MATILNFRYAKLALGLILVLGCSPTTSHAVQDSVIRPTNTTADRIVATDSGKKLVSVDDLTAWVAGTANRVTISNDGDGTATLTTPQDTHVGASPTFVTETLTGLTASKPVWTDGSKILISQDINACDIVRTHLTPAIQTVTTGTLISGTVSDVQTWADGNFVQVQEASGIPGFDVLYTFSNVASFCHIGGSAFYVGSSTHWAEIQIYDDTNTTWRTLWTFSSGLGFNYRFSDFPDQTNIADYINVSNEVKIRFYHPTSGNASHDLYIDYISITGSTI